jgi:hypothetical protein
MELLSPEDVLKKGLDFVRMPRENKSRDLNLENFHKHYGSAPLDLAEMWYDLTQTDIEGAKLNIKERSLKGFRFFMMAHYYLWTYEKNSTLLASRFGICESYCRGKPLWTWIKKIAALRERKIVWDDSLDSPSTEVFIISVDGTDMRVWEKKHSLLNVDKKQCSQKFKHGAVKYEIALSVLKPQCVHLIGPFRGGEHNLVMWRKELKEKKYCRQGIQIKICRGAQHVCLSRQYGF